MNDLLSTINAVLGTEHSHVDQVSTEELEGAIFLVKLNMLLDAKLDEAACQPVNIIARRFKDLDDGVPFSSPGQSGTYRKDTRLSIDPFRRTVCGHCSNGKANAMCGEWIRHFCPDDVVLLSFKDEPATTLFYKLEPGETFVIPDDARMRTYKKLTNRHGGMMNVRCAHCTSHYANAKRRYDGCHIHICPDDVVLPAKDEPATILFYKLEPGETFVIPDATTGTHRKLAIASQTGAYCIYDNCPPGEAWMNARDGNLVFVHICPDTVVVPVPF